MLDEEKRQAVQLESKAYEEALVELVTVASEIEVGLAFFLRNSHFLLALQHFALAVPAML